MPVDLNEVCNDPATARWILPALDQRTGADPTGQPLDTLRIPAKGDKSSGNGGGKHHLARLSSAPWFLDGDVFTCIWNIESCSAWGRFLAQGFLHDEPTRAVCLTHDPMPKVSCLGRLFLYGERASRLHDEAIAVAAEWLDRLTGTQEIALGKERKTTY